MLFRLGSVARRTVVATALAVVVAAVAVGGAGMRGRVGAAPAAPTLCPGVGGGDLAVAPKLPRSFNLAQPGAQNEADCIAWQSFIDLNWPVAPQTPCKPDQNAPSSDFGKPTGYTTVWESYPVASSLFVANPTYCGAVARAASRVKVLRAVSKIGDSVLEFDGVPMEAVGSWLTDQAGGLTYFEIHVNQDEADYIKLNGLNTVPGQARCAAAPGGFILPEGAGHDTDCNGKPHKYGDNVGAIELKAAWIVLNDPSQYSRFLTAKALVYPPSGSGPPQSATVGLVGLHIVRKMPGAHRMLWATFEHVDNAPDAPNGSPMPSAKPYTYFNASCNPSTDPMHCALNAPPSSPTPYSAPVQVGRLTPIGRTARSVNDVAHALIAKSAPSSVFRYYELVDVMWSDVLTGDIRPGSLAPLERKNMTSETQAVANTTMETYAQLILPRPSGARTCLNCHASATIATASSAQRTLRTPGGRPARIIRIFTRPQQSAAAAHGAATPTPPPDPSRYASDFSFIFSAQGN